MKKSSFICVYAALFIATLSPALVIVAAAAESSVACQHLIIQQVNPAGEWEQKLHLLYGANLPISPASLALFRAAFNGDISGATELLKECPNISTKDPTGMNILHILAYRKPFQNSDEEMVHLIVKHSVLDINLSAGPGVMAPLHFAVESGNDAVLNALLDCGADMEARDSLDQTPLHTAFWRYSHESDAVNILIERGANQEAQDMMGRIPIRLLPAHFAIADDDEVDTWAYTAEHVNAAVLNATLFLETLDAMLDEAEAGNEDVKATLRKPLEIVKYVAQDDGGVAVDLLERASQIVFASISTNNYYQNNPIFQVVQVWEDQVFVPSTSTFMIYGDRDAEMNTLARKHLRRIGALIGVIMNVQSRPAKSSLGVGLDEVVFRHLLDPNTILTSAQMSQTVVCRTLNADSTGYSTPKEAFQQNIEHSLGFDMPEFRGSDGQEAMMSWSVYCSTLVRAILSSEAFREIERGFNITTNNRSSFPVSDEGHTSIEGWFANLIGVSADSITSQELSEQIEFERDAQGLPLNAVAEDKVKRCIAEHFKDSNDRRLLVQFVTSKSRIPMQLSSSQEKTAPLFKVVWTDDNHEKEQHIMAQTCFQTLKIPLSSLNCSDLVFGQALKALISDPKFNTA